MSQEDTRLFCPRRFVKDLALIVPLWAFFTWVCHSHVPLQDPAWKMAGAVFTAVALTMTAWFAFHMLRFVARHERAKKLGRED